MAPPKTDPILDRWKILLFRCPLVVSWRVQYLTKGPKLDFNNCLWDNLNSGCILAHRRLFHFDSNNGPSPSHSSLGQMEDTPVQVSHLWSPGECNIWPKAPGLTSIMAQEITRIVAAFWPLTFIRVQFE